MRLLTATHLDGEDMVIAGSSFAAGDVVFRAGPRLTSRERPERGLGQVNTR